MADQKQLDRLLEEGVQAWNEWRAENLGVELNLRGAFCSDADLTGADLRNAILIEAEFHNAILTDAILTGAKLFATNLTNADLSGASLWSTVFGDVDLSTVKGLETVNHHGPSIIGIDTVYRSRGMIPEVFLKGAGVPDSFIEYMSTLVGSHINYSSCFISYSSKDLAFAERLYADLQSKGVRCWFAPHDMRIGDEIRPRIDESIRVHDKLLLVLSENSITSTWVKKEVETTFEKEAQQNKSVLFPIRLDESVMHTPQAWAADIRRMRHIGDFNHWKDHDQYQKAFTRLLRDLQPTS